MTMTIKNPAEITFDPFTVDDEQNAKEDGVHIRDIFEDPLQRTIWIGYKSHFLTNQYFRSGIVRVATQIRIEPPRLPCMLNFGCLDGGFGGLFGVGLEFKVALFPFIVWALMQENLWRWFLPKGCEPTELTYVVTRAMSRNWCRGCKKDFHQFRDEPRLVYCSPECEGRHKRLGAGVKRTRMIAFPGDLD